MNLSRIRRLLELIGLLQAGPGYNANALAQACGVSRRTIFRDLDVLRKSGVPLVFNEQRQQYRIPDAYFLPPTNFTPEEALALIVLSHEMGDHMGVPFFKPARSAALKLQSSLPARLRQEVRSLTGAVNIRPEPNNALQGCRSIYDELVRATARRKAVRISYKGPNDADAFLTKLSPYRVFFSRRSWYVAGRSSLHRGTRTFNLSRIQQVEPLQDTFEVPRGFSLDRYLGNAWHLIPEPGRDVEVVVRFSKLVAQNVAEVVWHKTQQVVFGDDGSLEFSVTVSGLGEISWWILGYGDQAEVLKPPALRRLVADRARRMLEHYEKAKRPAR